MNLFYTRFQIFQISDLLFFHSCQEMDFKVMKTQHLKEIHFCKNLSLNNSWKFHYHNITDTCRAPESLSYVIPNYT